MGFGRQQTLCHRHLGEILLDLFGHIPGSCRELGKVIMYHDVLSWEFWAFFDVGLKYPSTTIGARAMTYEGCPKCSTRITSDRSVLQTRDFFARKTF
ncbi:hypothetical protein DFP92_10287 [Yoonia sediminilitoris]|uniref:Uncharacterized protein n=1 Tax=Yoonia sediminilitoris TaxID=1286148 RepID=A0A2T6KLP3_9RHOB|nr:hypothetical protein C8N45_10287 [Yoonia sediminilitoris]RCW97372.1 hypothetical protein DFP92_10287 [Yoonia sediminilitoris]